MEIPNRWLLAASVAALTCTSTAFERIAFVDHLDFHHNPPHFDIQTEAGIDEVLDHVMLVRPTTGFWRTTTGGDYRYTSPSEKHPLRRTPLDVRRPPLVLGQMLPWLNWDDVPTNLLAVAAAAQKRRGMGFGLHFPLEENHASSPWMIGTWSLAHPASWVNGNRPGQSPWMGACRFTNRAALEHKLRVIDEVLFDGLDTFMLDLGRTGGWTAALEGEPLERVAKVMSFYIRAVAKKVHAKGTRFLLTLPQINNIDGTDDYTYKTFGIEWQKFAADGTIDGVVLHTARPSSNPDHVWSSVKKIYESLMRQRGQAKVFLPVAMYGWRFGMNEFAKAAKVSRAEATLKMIALAKEVGADGITFECVDYCNYPPDVIDALNRDVPGDRILTEGMMPVYSPDGKFVAYEREFGDHMRLGAYEIATGRTTWTPETSGDAAHPAWHPRDGSLIYSRGDEKLTAAAAVVAKAQTGYHLHRVNPGKNSTRRELTTGRFYDYTPSYSPDGKFVYFASTRFLPSQNDLWKKWILSGSGLCRLSVTDGKLESVLPIDRPVNRANPVVSPDGRFLAWAELEGLGVWNVKVARVSDLSAAATVGSESQVSYGPRWSADGRYLIYTGFRAGDSGWGVYVTECASGATRRLFDGEHPCFHPTGKKVVYVRDGIIYEHVLAEGELPRAQAGEGEPAVFESAKVLFKETQVEWKNYPLPSQLVPGTKGTAYMRARIQAPAKLPKVAWMVANCRFKEAGAGLQLCAAGEAAGFATRTVPDRYTPIWNPRQIVPGEEFELVGIRHEGKMYVSINGGMPIVKPISGTMVSLDTPLKLDVIKTVGCEGIDHSPCTYLEVGTGWPEGVPHPPTLPELMSGKSRSGPVPAILR